MPEHVYIYQDAGVSPWCVSAAKRALEFLYGQRYTIQLISSIDVRKGSWKAYAKMFVMPGGASRPYCEKLSGQGNDHIRHYVETGGTYLGLCAGAYYAASRVEFDKQGPLEVIGNRELHFFKGVAIGPLIPYVYQSQKGASILTVRDHEGKKWTTYYNGGGYFHSHNITDDSMTILARYPDQKAAVIGVTIGKGRAILSGIHPEITCKDLESRIQSGTEPDSEIKLLHELTHQLAEQEPYAFLATILPK